MKVFLSSTAQDLEAYRRVADDTILRLAQQSIAMERFGPLPDTPVEECERLARESDVVVCIVAHRYGYVPEKGRGSITRREIEAAHKAGKDVLVWIIDDSHPWTENKEQDLLADPSVVADPAKVADVAEGVAGLLDFKAWLRKTFTPDKFTTPDDLGRKIAVALANYVKGRHAPPVPQDKISIARLPASGAELFGRETELKLLDDAWENPNTNIVGLVAWGGVGKTAVINHWLKRRMARDNYRGAERVFGWSFFSQGVTERAASADLFIDQALRWFDDPDPTEGSPWDKGERLANYIRQSKTLLILDGLEPLQYPPGSQEGRVKDPAMQALLVELAARQRGLCVISTRERVGDLVEFENGTVVQHDLEHLSPEAGAQILRSLKVTGEEQELQQASKEVKGHAFSLTLLGSYLDEVLNGDIRRRNEIESLFDDTRYGDVARLMLLAYEKWLGEGIELAMLRLLGLFDRPADLPSLIALRQPPAIHGLTEPLQAFKAQEWNKAVSKLRRLKLLAEESPTEAGSLDAHPLVREYFKHQLSRERHEAWVEANNRLYEHLQKTAPELPASLREMAPLYSAVAHGCAAGKYKEAVDIYWRRILRRKEFFNQLKLGAFAADLAVLSSFFEFPWADPWPGLTGVNRYFILGQAGVDLRAVGRAQESLQPLERALREALDEESWEIAGTVASNLSQSYLAMGNLEMALKLALQYQDIVNRNDIESRKVSSSVVLGHTYHQMGLMERATAAFEQAGEHEPTVGTSVTYRNPSSFASYLYCDLLVDQGRTEEVKQLAARAIETYTEESQPLIFGLHNLSLGVACLVESTQNVTSDFPEAAIYLNRAIEALRKGGHMEFLPRGLLARANLHRLVRAYGQAERDLADVQRMATRSGLGLCLTDYHLEFARLQITQEAKDCAREHLAIAKEMINRMGYHRRDKEVCELEEQLG
jgi:tetratricopeptide (TPR) repeat protein